MNPATTIQSEVPTLPGALANYVNSVSARYGVEPLSALAGCLVAATGTAGRKAAIQRVFNETVTPGNLFCLATTTTANLCLTWNDIVAPIRAMQNEMLADATIEAKDVVRSEIKKHEKWRCDRMPRSGACRFDSDYQYHTFAIQRLLPKLYPAVTLDRLDKNTVRSTLLQSADGSLLLASKGFLIHPRDLDADLLSRCIRNLSVADLFKSDTPAAALSPVISGLGIVLPDDAFKLFEQIDRPEIHSGIIWLTESGTPNQTAHPGLKPMPEQRLWEGQLQRIINLRHAPRFGIEATDDARSLLWGFRNELAGESNIDFPFDAYSNFAHSELSVRIALAIWLAGTDHKQPVDLSIASAAIRVTRMIRSRHADFRRSSDRSRFGHSDEVILSRIRAKGAIRRRELFRTFSDQRKAVHEPVIQRLLADGRIIEEESGRLRPGRTVDIKAEVMPAGSVQGANW